MPGKLLSKGHECELPSTTDLKRNAIYRCDCGQYWRTYRESETSTGPKNPEKDELVWEPVSQLAAALAGYPALRDKAEEGDR